MIGREALLPGIQAELDRIRPNLGAENEEEEPEDEGCFGTSNLRALWGMFILNTLFAAAQMIAAAIANSLSMFSDSGSMLVDSFAYLVNILLERKKHLMGPLSTKLLEVYASVTSVGLLVAVTIFAIADATVRLKNDSEDDESTVDGRIVFGFASGNLFLDLVMCFNYCYQLRHRRKANLRDEFIRETHEELNMVSAFVHLIADTLRSFTSIVAGVLEARMETKAVAIDAIATYFVCTAILLAAGFVFYEAFIQYREYQDSVRIQEQEQSNSPTYDEIA